MKILLLNQFFWPDSSATSQLLTDLARALAASGHQVTAICADKGGYAATSASATATSADGISADAPPVRIVRVQALPFARGNIGRVLSYFSFYFFAAARSLTLPRQDVVLTLTTPPLLSLLGTLLKKLRGPRHFIWEMDVYPDVALDLGYFQPGTLVAGATGLLADFSRRNADGIIALGECMKERLIRRGIRPELIFVSDNWADGAAIVPLPRPGDPGQLTLLYSGNLGLAHDLSTVTGAIEALRDDRRFRFLFVGSGGRRRELAEFIAHREIDSVELRPYVERESLGESLSAGDIGLVTQREACCGSVVPSKVYGLLAAGRPLLFIGPAQATPARIIERFGCGWHIDVGESGRLTELLQRLASRREEVELAGVRARKALLDHFDLRHGVERMMAILTGETLGDARAARPSQLAQPALSNSAGDFCMKGDFPR